MAEEISNQMWAAVYHALVAGNKTSAAKALLKDLGLKTAPAAPSDSLISVFTSYLDAKKKSVTAEESSSGSESSSSSESEDEKPVAKKSATPAKKAESSGSESDSESEDDKPVGKKATIPTKKVAPPAKKAESSSEDSDSESEDEKPVAKPVAKQAAKKESSSEDSDSDDSESEDEKPPAKVGATPSKTTPAKKAASSSSESESESEEEEAPKPVAGKRKAGSSSSSSSESSESEEEKPVKKSTPAPTPKKAEPPAKKARVEAAATPSAGGGEFVAYLQGLPWTAEDSEVKGFFTSVGNIVNIELPLAENGRSSGTALVTFGSRSALDSALELNGQIWPGTERWVRIVENKAARKSPGPPASTTKPEGCDTVFVGNLPWDVEEAQMIELFSSCGEVAKVRFATSAEDGSFKGFAHVQFVDGNSTDAAVKLYGTDLNGREIRVDYAPPRNRDSLGGGEGRGRGGGGRGGRGDSGGRGRGDFGRGRGRGGAPSTGNKNKGTIASAPQGKKISFD